MGRAISMHERQSESEREKGGNIPSAGRKTWKEVTRKIWKLMEEVLQ